MDSRRQIYCYWLHPASVQPAPGFSLPPAGLKHLHDHTLIVSELFALFSLGVSGSSCVRFTEVSRLVMALRNRSAVGIYLALLLIVLLLVLSILKCLNK